MKQERFIYLINRYSSKAISVDEKTELKALLNELEQSDIINVLSDHWLNEASPFISEKEQDIDIQRQIEAILSVDRQESDHRNMPQHVLPAHRVHFLKTAWFRYAAAVILLVGGAAVWYDLSQRPQSSSSPQAGVSRSPDIAPGTNRAILTVGNKTIDLATNKTGIAVNNAFTYNDGEEIGNLSPVILAEGRDMDLVRLATPRGGQYQAVLPDGSKVWLNAASSIRFPSKFTGKTREVEIEGEAYLEIAKNTKQPFYIRTNKTTIQVLGTSFNINAYEDEETEKTTLIEGSVKVKAADREAVLKPGEQAEINNGAQLTTHSADIEQALAWKNNMFQFKEATIQDVMRQLARWYDVEVIYEGELKPQHFNWGISRNVELSKVIKMLEATDAFHFRIEGKKVYVIP